MIRRPPISTLFPTRRSSDLLVDSDRNCGLRRERIVQDERRALRSCRNLADEATVGMGTAHHVRAAVEVRSEEHTSELQSHSDLVCRLLLEKKKTKMTN